MNKSASKAASFFRSKCTGAIKLVAKVFLPSTNPKRCSYPLKGLSSLLKNCLMVREGLPTDDITFIGHVTL